MKLLGRRLSRSETLLAGTLVVLLTGLSLDWVVGSVYAPRKERTMQSLHDTEMLLQRYRNLREDEDGLRREFAALQAKRRDEASQAVGSPREALRFLQRLVESEVRLLSIVPIEPDGPDARLSFTVEFIDERGHLGRLLQRLPAELKGEVTALEVTAGAAEAGLRCHATIRFDVAEDAEASNG